MFHTSGVNYVLLVHIFFNFQPILVRASVVEIIIWVILGQFYILKSILNPYLYTKSMAKFWQANKNEKKKVAPSRLIKEK